MERLRMGCEAIGKRGWRDLEEKGMEYRLMVERVYLGCRGAACEEEVETSM